MIMIQDERSMMRSYEGNERERGRERERGSVKKEHLVVLSVVLRIYQVLYQVFRRLKGPLQIFKRC